MATQDRITEIRIQGVRVLKDVKLGLNGLTVLIGENGTGKSSIVEVCRLLSQVPSREGFVNQFMSTHGGFYSLLRRGESKLTIGATVTGNGTSLDYDLTLGSDGISFYVETELLAANEPGGRYTVLSRDRTRGLIMDKKYSTVPMGGNLSQDPSLGWFAMGGPSELTRMADALRSIEVHLPFDTTPSWAGRLTKKLAAMRGSSLLQPAEHLSLFGDNLANAYYALRNKPLKHWQRTMDYVQLGLGEDVESVDLPADPGGGAIAIGVRRRGLKELETSFVLSDGQLAYLATVAIFRLETPFTLLVFDEPDLHLHPGLLVRVLDMFEQMSERGTVLLTTHSGRLLDALRERAADSARLLELDDQRATQILRPDRESLTKWLDDYSGLGAIRDAGFGPAVFVPDSVNG